MSRTVGSLVLAVSLAFGAAFLTTNSALAEPVEYVKVCDAFGSGFYYIPGTDTCLRIGGRVRSSILPPVQTGEGWVCGGRYFTASEDRCSRRPGPDAQYVRRCDLGSGGNYYYIPGTDQCIRLNDNRSSQRAPGYNWSWIGVGVGGTATNHSVDTVFQQTFNVFDALSDDSSAGLGSAGFRGDVDFGWDMIVGNWPNTGMPLSLGVQGSIGYSGTDTRVDRIPGSGLFTPMGSGTDYFRLQGGLQGSFGARLGTFVTPSLMLYAIGGAAFQEFKATINCGSGLCAQNGIQESMLTESQMRWGYYVGGGFMMPIPNLAQWTMGVELRNTDYGDWTVTQGDPAQYRGQFTVHLSEVSAVFRVHRNF